MFTLITIAYIYSLLITDSTFSEILTSLKAKFSLQYL